MKTRTTLTGLFVMLARPLLDALRDECSVWREHGSHGRDDYNSPAGVDREATLEPSPTAMPESAAGICPVVAAAEPVPSLARVEMPEPTMTISVMVAAELARVAIPEPSVTIPVMVATVATPEPVFTIPAQGKREKKPAKQSPKPAAKSAARTSANPRKPAPRSKHAPACSTT